MHVEADLLDSVGEVAVGEYQVLEGFGETPKVSRISNRRLRLGGDFGLCVHRRRNRLAVHNAHPPDVVRRLLENDGGARDLSW
jgi:hypothetical protein